MFWIPVKHQFLSLGIVSVVCGLIWRAEIEYHGWAGLIWVSYFHYAVPIGFILFLLWANYTISISGLKRITVNVIALVYLVLVHISLKSALTYTYMSGPRKFLMLIVSDLSENQLLLLHYSSMLLLFLIPIFTYIVQYIFTIHMTLNHLALSILGLIVAVPTSLFLLKITGHIGGANLIHSIKSGIIIPFVVFSIGLLFIRSENNKT